MPFRALLLLFFQLLCAVSFAQKPALGFYHLSVNDGLSENTVRAIIEDANGYMWFGSEDGLNRFDGYNFVAYHNDKNENTTLSSRNIKFLFNDSKKHLWILTTNGANIYDPQLDNFCNYKNNKYPALKPLTNDVSGITEDRNGTIWIGTDKEGLFKIESLQKAPKQYLFPDDDLSKHFLSLFSENDSTLWIGTQDGLLKFNPLTGVFTDCRTQYGHGYVVRQIFKDPQGKIWLCTNRGLKAIGPDHQMKEYTFNLNNLKSISGDNVISMTLYKGNSYFLAIDGGGLDLFNTSDETFYHYRENLSSKNVLAAYKDSKGDLWVGTYLNGINYSNSTTNLFILNKNNLYSNKSIKEGIVTDFLKDSKGELWITTDGGGLYRKRPGQEEYKNYSAGDKGLSSNTLISIIEDDQSNLWISSYGGGLIHYIRATDQFKVYTEKDGLFTDYTKALKYYKGDLWISGYGAGLGILHTATGKFEHIRADEKNPHTIQSNWVIQFFIDKKGALWLCTFKGLTKYLPETKNFITFTFKSRNKNTQTDINTITDLEEDENGNLWIGTLGSGLICLNPITGRYIYYTTKQGLSNNCIKSVILDDYSHLWLSTNTGITMFDIKTRKAKAYSNQDGLPSCSFYINSKYKDEQGLIYLGTNIGYLIINPLLNISNNRIPPVVITSFKIFNQVILPDTLNSPLRYTISETKKITLPYSKNSISFEYSALNFNSSRNNQYAYILEGFDDRWFFAGRQRTATYTNLNPGKYTFRVKGSNNDGVWNDQGAVIEITILPPFWLTWWFFLILALALIISLYLIHRWRIRNIHQKNLVLERTVEKRTQDLLIAKEQLETFIYRTSHDLQGPLKSIIGLTNVGKKEFKNESGQIYFDHILTSTRKLENLLKDLIQLVRARGASPQMTKIDFKKLIDEILTSLSNIPNYKEMQISVNISDNLKFSSDYYLLYSAVQNIIENAIKYSDPDKQNKTLWIYIEARSNFARLTFSDNGMGIPDGYLDNIFDMFYKANENATGSGLGLYIVKRTIEQLGGTIHVSSKFGEGTTFTILMGKKS